MKYLENYGAYTPKKKSKLQEIIAFINPSDPTMSDEYYYYIWGDDEAYHNDSLTTDDYIKAIEDTVFVEGSKTAGKFGWEYINSIKQEILDACRAELN